MALVKCSRCQGEISDKARVCPHCHFSTDFQAGGNASVAVKVRSERPLKTKPNPFWSGTQGLFICLGLFFIVRCAWQSEKKIESVPLSGLSFVDFDSEFCSMSRATDLQKKERIKSMEGTRVRWRGIVSYVSDDSVGIRHKASTLTHDVLLSTRKDQHSTLIELREGEMMEYEGLIYDYGEIISHRLKNGVILSHHAMSAEDTLLYLARTETEVLERIEKK